MAKSDLSSPPWRMMVEPVFDDDGVQRTAGVDSLGREHGDPVPNAPPVGLGVPKVDPLYDQLRKMFLVERAKLDAAVAADEFETEAEADDFLCDDDLFPPGNEPWADVHDFLAAEEGRRAALAGSPPNGQNRAPEEAAGQPSTSSDQRVSAGSSSASPSSASLPQMRTGVFPSPSSLPVDPGSGSGDSSGKTENRPGSVSMK